MQRTRYLVLSTRHETATYAQMLQECPWFETKREARATLGRDSIGILRVTLEVDYRHGINRLRGKL